MRVSAHPDVAPDSYRRESYGNQHKAVTPRNSGHMLVHADYGEPGDRMLAKYPMDMAGRRAHYAEPSGPHQQRPVYVDERCWSSRPDEYRSMGSEPLPPGGPADYRHSAKDHSLPHMGVKRRDPPRDPRAYGMLPSYPDDPHGGDHHGAYSAYGREYMDEPRMNSMSCY